MPYIDGKRVTMEEWLAANPLPHPWKSNDTEPAPAPEPPPVEKPTVRKTGKRAAIKAATGVVVEGGE